MNAKQRSKNRQTAEALHYAIQTTSSRNHYRLKAWQPQGHGGKATPSRSPANAA
jgi:hypothetical protein